MQYTIIINQVKAVEWGLSPSQAALMAFVYELESWGKDVVKDNFAYKWISKQKVIEELPLFFAKPNTVHKSLIELEKKGLIIRNFTGKLSLVKLTKTGQKWRVKLGNKSDVRSDLNPIKVGNKSHVRSDLNHTDHSTSIIGTTINKKTTKKAEEEKKKSELKEYLKTTWNEAVSESEKPEQARRTRITPTKSLGDIQRTYKIYKDLKREENREPLSLNDWLKNYFPAVLRYRDGMNKPDREFDWRVPLEYACRPETYEKILNWGADNGR